MAIRRSRSQAFVLRAPFLLIMCKDGKAAFGRPIALPMHARELIELAGLVSAWAAADGRPAAAPRRVPRTVLDQLEGAAGPLDADAAGVCRPDRRAASAGPMAGGAGNAGGNLRRRGAHPGVDRRALRLRPAARQRRRRAAGPQRAVGARRGPAPHCWSWQAVRASTPRRRPN